MKYLYFSVFIVFLSFGFFACHSAPELQKDFSSAITIKPTAQLPENIANQAVKRVDFQFSNTIDLQRSSSFQKGENTLSIKPHNKARLNQKNDSLSWSKRMDETIQNQSITVVQKQISNISFPKLLTYFLNNLR